MDPNAVRDFYYLSSTELSAGVIVFNIVFAFILGFIVIWVYKKTHQGLSYSQSFLTTVLLMSPLGAVVMMIVGNNLIGAFGLLGAFSLIRFRTIIKEARDVVFVFFALANGVAVGTNNYTIALASVVIISSVVLILKRYNFNSQAQEGFILSLTTRGDFNIHTLRSTLKEYTEDYTLLHAKTKDTEGEYAFLLKLKNAESIDGFLEKIRKNPLIQQSTLITGRDSVEY